MFFVNDFQCLNLLMVLLIDGQLVESINFFIKTGPLIKECAVV